MSQLILFELYSSLGATVTAFKVPDKHGRFADVILGFDNAQDYLNSPKPYFGATVGRVANRYVIFQFIYMTLKI